MAMIWAMALLVVAVLATVICAGYAVVLHRSGDPGWKLPGAMALMCLASWASPLTGNLLMLVGVSLGLTAIAVYLAWRYRREHGRFDPGEGQP